MSFIDYYPIITLPRVTDVELSQKVVIPPITNINETIIDIGISKSNISSYIIKPSPRLIWSYPISPSCVIECMDCKDHETYIVGVTDRKVHKLLYLQKNGDAKEVKVTKTVKGVKYIGDQIFVIFQDGEFIFIHDIDEINVKKSSKSELIYYNISDDKILIITKNASQFNYKLFNLQGELLNELTEKYSDSIFKYCDNHIYKYSNKAITKLNLNFKIIKTFNIGIDVTSMVIPNDDRIVLSHHNKLMIMNMQYETLLDELDINEDIFITSTVEVNGSNTLILFLKLNNKKNKLTLNISNVNVGMNNLVSNLGKKFQKTTPKILELDNLTNITEATTRENSLIKDLTGIDGEAFDKKCLQYFKHDDVKLGYYAFDDGDRIIDVNLIDELFKLENFTPLDHPHIMYYLLSHPLFPLSRTTGLLTQLKASQNAKLIKQCIVLTPNLPIDELLELFITNDETNNFKEIVNRICKFNLLEIIPNFQHILVSHNNHDNIIDVILKKLIKLDNLNSWSLIKLIIDINGLFNLSNELIDEIILLINDKLDILELNNFNLTLLNANNVTKANNLPNYALEKLVI